MKKKLPLSSLEKKLDRIFSEFIRRRDADEGGTVSCCTCGKLMHWSESHAGHFIKRQHRATRWSPENVHVQCPGCNVYRGGCQDEYAAYIIKRYGVAVFDDLMRLKHTTVKLIRADFEALIEQFKSMVAAL